MRASRESADIDNIAEEENTAVPGRDGSARHFFRRPANEMEDKFKSKTF